jgi:hypothetical protein
MRINTTLISAFLVTLTLFANAQMPNMMLPAFTVETANKFSDLACNCISSNYPVRVNHIALNNKDIKAVSEIHPAFKGCYTWSSSVSNYWMLVTLLQKFPDLKKREQIIELIDLNLTAEKISIETVFFNNEGNESIERPYGWAWLLKLSAELANSENEFEKRWFQNLLPLAEAIKTQYYDYLSGLYYPIRKGTSDNTAFGIAFALDYAKAVNDITFEAFLKERARFYFFNDRNIPASWEPEGDDFLSPSLIVADLMRRVLPKEDFVRWFKNYLPDIPFSLMSPAVVTNRSGSHGYQLDGLNLSRAWCMFELAKVLPDESKPHRELWQAGYRHAAEALPHILLSNNTSTNWLASYAVYMYLTIADISF